MARSIYASTATGGSWQLPAAAAAAGHHPALSPGRFQSRKSPGGPRRPPARNQPARAARWLADSALELEEDVDEKVLKKLR